MASTIQFCLFESTWNFVMSVGYAQTCQAPKPRDCNCERLLIAAHPPPTCRNKPVNFLWFGVEGWLIFMCRLCLPWIG